MYVPVSPEPHHSMTGKPPPCPSGPETSVGFAKSNIGPVAFQGAWSAPEIAR